VHPRASCAAGARDRQGPLRGLADAALLAGAAPHP
jgi:hypothetical protein